MKLTEYIQRRNERPITWGLVCHWIPDRTSRYSYLRVFWVTLAITVLVPGLLWVANEAFVRTGIMDFGTQQVGHLRPWMLRIAAEWAASVGLCWSFVSRLCWNQRAARLTVSPESPELTQAWPRRGFFTGTLPGWSYFFIVALATPTLLFYAIENVRGAWAWHEMQSRLRTDGVCYELNCFVPPPARDEENFFATPFWKNFEYRTEPDANGQRPAYIWAVTNWNEKLIQLPDGKSLQQSAGQRQFEDTDGRVELGGWARAFRDSTTAAAQNPKDAVNRSYPVPPTPGAAADDVLMALSRYDGYLAEFAAAALRPRNRYPAHYEDLFSTIINHVSQIRAGAQTCQLRALAFLARGNPAAAATNTVLGFRLAESLGEDVFVISQLVRFTSDAINLHTLWEGMIAHQWNEAQLRIFQDILIQRDYTHAMARSMEAERAMGCAEMERTVHDRWNQLLRFDGLRDDRNEDAFSDAIKLETIPYLMPTGWLRWNQIHLMEGYQLLIDTARTKLAEDRSLAVMKAGQDREQDYDKLIIEYYGRGPEYWVARQLLPALGKASDKANRAQTLARMGVIACALEHHYIAQH